MERENLKKAAVFFVNGVDQSTSLFEINRRCNLFMLSAALKF